MNKRWLVGGVVIVAAVIGAWLWWPRGGTEPKPAAGSAASKVATVDKTGADPAARGGVDGVVLDDKGAAVAAVVRAVPASSLADPDDAAIASSGPDGKFALDLATGSWILTASAAGHAPAQATAVVAPGQRARVELRLAPGGVTLEGTVVDATGGPVGGALVVASIEEGVLATDATHASAAETDADGHFAIGLVPGRWSLVTSHPEYQHDVRALDVGPSGAKVDIALTPGGAVEGTVRDAASHAPVAGARVHYAREVIASGPMRAGGARERDRGMVVAGSDGHFRVSGLGSGRIVLTAETDDDRASAGDAEVLLGVADTVTDVDVFVAPALSISGRVAYDDGTPAAGAQVSLDLGGDESKVIADDQGKFHLGGLHPGRFALVAQSEDAPPSDPVPVELADKPVTDAAITLRRGVFISGRVDPPGPADISVEAGDATPTFATGSLTVATGGRTTRAAPDGTFRIGPFAPGDIKLAGKDADGRRGSVTVPVAKAPVADVVIALEAKGRIAGRVVTKAGAVVPGAVVTIRRAADEGAADRQTIVNGVDVGADRAPTSLDGRFSVEGLDAGSYELRVLDARGGPIAFDRDDKDGAETVALAANQQQDDVELVVEAEDGTITGTVVGVDGAPVADAWVTLTPDDQPLAGMAKPKPAKSGSSSSMMITIVDDAGPQAGEIPPVLTGDDGKFGFAHLRNGNYRVAAEGMKGGARGAVDPVATGGDVTIKLVALSSLRGTVTIGGKPVADYHVSVDGPTRKDTGVHDPGGAFSITGLDPGHYTLDVVADAGTGHAIADVTAGQEATVTVELIGDGKVSGKLLDAQGKPLAGRMVIVGDRMKSGEMRIELGGEPPTTGADGSFTAPSPPGPRTLFILGQQGPELRKDLDVVAGQTTELGTLTPDPGSLGEGPP